MPTRKSCGFGYWDDYSTSGVTCVTNLTYYELTSYTLIKGTSSTSDFTVTANRLKYTGATTKKFDISIGFSYTNGNTNSVFFRATIYKTGSIVTGCSKAIRNHEATAPSPNKYELGHLRTITTLATNDVISIACTKEIGGSGTSTLAFMGVSMTAIEI